MGDLNALKKGIIAEAGEEAARIRSEAEDRAAALLDEAKKTADERRSGIVRMGEREAAERRRRIEIAAELDKKRALLLAKDRVIKDAVELSLQQLYNLSPDRKAAWFSAGIFKSVENGDEEIRPATPDRAVIETILPGINNELQARGLKGQLRLGADEPGIKGGFIITGENYQADNSIESILNGIKDDLIPEVAKILFE